jgi:hypothetical protein
MTSGTRCFWPSCPTVTACADTMARRFELCDGALLAAFLIVALVGTWNRVLLVNDGAYFLSVTWLGDAWELYFNQFGGRAIALLVMFGPAWALRWALEPSADTHLVVGHLLYFAAPLCLWLALRAVEPSRVFSRLYLAAMLALIYFPTEVIVAAGIWLVWIALIADPARPARQTIVITLGFALVLAFTHPVAAMMSLLYLAVGGALAFFGRSFPGHSLKPAAAMTVLLLLGYVLTSRLLPSTNPSIIGMQGASSRDYLDPLWMLSTIVLFPMLGALWLLLLAPGVAQVGPQWRLTARGATIIGVFGLWFAANAASLYLFLFTRHTVSYVLAVALALALAGPSAAWLAQARRPLLWCAAITTVAALSYNFDILLLRRFVDRHLVSGVTDVDQQASMSWPRSEGRTLFEPRLYFKWAAGADYTRDVVVPDYERYRQVLAFISFFQSDRQSVLFHRLPRSHWIPFECAPLDDAIAGAHDAADRRFLVFLRENYCVR